MSHTAATLLVLLWLGLQHPLGALLAAFQYPKDGTE